MDDDPEGTVRGVRGSSALFRHVVTGGLVLSGIVLFGFYLIHWFLCDVLTYAGGPNCGPGGVCAPGGADTARSCSNALAALEWALLVLGGLMCVLASAGLRLARRLGPRAGSFVTPVERAVYGAVLLALGLSLVLPIAPFASAILFLNASGLESPFFLGLIPLGIGALLLGSPGRAPERQRGVGPPPRSCVACGRGLALGANYCEACGRPVRVVPA